MPLLILCVCLAVDAFARPDARAEGSPSAAAPGKDNSFSGPGDAACASLRLILNPPEAGPEGESALASQLRRAYNKAVAGDFDAAIDHYRRAAELCVCDCACAVAQAGASAAAYARDLDERLGSAAKPTQAFWYQLRDLTDGLHCVRIDSGVP